MLFRISDMMYFLGAGMTDSSLENLKNGIKFKFGQTRKAVLFYPHEKYNIDKRRSNDIAFYKVKKVVM